MPVTSHKAVIAGVDLLADRSLGRMAKRYRRDLDGLVAAIKKAKSPEGLRRALGPTLLKRMGTGAVTDALSGAGVQAALIGKTAARPSGNAETSKRGNVETKKLSAVNRQPRRPWWWVLN